MSPVSTQPVRSGQYTPDPVCNCCRDGSTCAKRTPTVDGCRDLRPIPLVTSRSGSSPMQPGTRPAPS